MSNEYKYNREGYLKNRQKILEANKLRQSLLSPEQKEKEKQKRKESYYKNREKIILRRKELNKLKKSLLSPEEKEKEKLERKKLYYKNREKILLKKKQDYPLNKEKILLKSKQDYSLNKEKILAKNKKWRDNNKESLLKRGRERWAKNKDKYGAMNREWQKNNQDYIKEYRKKTRPQRNIYERKKRAEDINYKIGKNMRLRMYQAIVGGGAKKYETTYKLLGCSKEFFKSYLENKFKPGMTWDNYTYNGWQIDHIIPIASFDLSKEGDQKKCFHYTNCQPLWRIENQSKGDKIIK
jgi:hypothetical protein